ncbi:MAG TPA: DUF2252 domain-containing protein [Actinomycetes bacterium]|nr:DUF2252 domain-containing protein [Actinomycetes bacterium]
MSSLISKHRSLSDRTAAGRAARQQTPRGALAEHVISVDRPDPVELLHESDAVRDAELLPLKYERMSASPFAFFRGFAAIQSFDLAQGPRTSVTTQLCGDLHLSNLGVFASPERNLLFDLNDFDETLPGPFEWDLKRLVTSFAVLGRHRGFSPAVVAESARTVVRAYRTRINELAEVSTLSVWYDRIDEQLLEQFAVQSLSKKDIKQFRANLAKARRKTSSDAAAKLTEVTPEGRRFRSNPPLLTRIDAQVGEPANLLASLHNYHTSLVNDRRHLLEHFRLIDIARKVVGVGSVGTRCWVLLFEGRDADDLLILQAKEAGPSVLEGHLRKSVFRHSGRRVVEGQRLMQAQSDIFLGWTTGPIDAARHYYVRQLRDMKGGVDPERITPTMLPRYAQICGMAAARAHARGGDPVEIAAYLGNGDRADRALVEYGLAYADQNEKDFAAFMASRVPS